MNPLYAAMPVSIFERMSLAAAAHGAVNLGQGFPDFGWPEPLVAEAARLLSEGSNQYPPSRGLPALRQAVADHYRRHQQLDLTAFGGATRAAGPSRVRGLQVVGAGAQLSGQIGQVPVVVAYQAAYRFQVPHLLAGNLLGPRGFRCRRRCARCVLPGAGL